MTPELFPEIDLAIIPEAGPEDQAFRLRYARGRLQTHSVEESCFLFIESHLLEGRRARSCLVSS
jgi:hypothetical protein